MPRILWILFLLASACSEQAISLPGGEGRISVFEREQSVLSQVNPEDFTYPSLPPERPNPDWTQAGGTVSTQKGHLKLGASPRQVWQVALPTESAFLSVPVVAQGSVFIFDAQTATVSAWRAENGETLWNTTLQGEDGQALSGGVAWSQGLLYVATGYAELFALNAENGEIIWRRGIPAPPRGAPTILEDLLYLSTTDSRVMAFFTADGGLSWEYSGLIESIGLLKSSSPATNGEVVIVGTPAGEIIGLNARTGSLLWADDLNQADTVGAIRILPDILGQPVIFDRDVYVISHSGILVALDLQQGTRLWERRVSSLDTPWLAGETLYVLTTRSELVAFHRQDGRILWFTQLQRYQDEESQNDRVLWSGPILAGGKLWLTNSQKELIGLNAVTGVQEARYEMESEFSLAPIVAQETLYLLSQDARLTAFR